MSTPDPGTEVDRSAPVPLTQAQVAQQLRLRAHTVLHLVARGFFRIDPSKRFRAAILLDPGWDLRLAIDDWLAGLEAPSTYDLWDRYYEVRVLLGIHKTEEHPDLIKAAAADFLLPMGGIHSTEVQAVLRCGHDGALSRRLTDELRLLAGRAVRRRRAVGIKALDLDLFAEIMPAGLRELPDTALDPSGPAPAPSGRELAAIARMRHVRSFGAVAALVVAASSRRPGALERTLGDLASIDRLVEELGIDWKNPSAMNGAMLALLEGKACAGMSDVMRRLAVSGWLMLERYVRSYRDRQPERLRALLDEILPTPDPDVARLRRAAHRLLKRIRQAAQVGRKHRVAALRTDLERTMVALDRRCDQLGAVADACRAAADELARHGSEMLDFEVLGPVLRMDGSFGEGVQAVRMRAWTERALLADFTRSPADYRLEVAWNLRNLVRRRNASDRVFFEHLGVSPAEAGRDGSEQPFYVEPLVTMATGHAITMPNALRERRRELFMEYGLPPVRGGLDGLFSFDAEGAAILRAAARRGRTVLPVLEFEHAMRYAHLALRTCSATGARLHEVMQMAENRSRWRAVATPQGGRPAFLAIDKLPGDRHLAVATETEHLLDAVTFRYKVALVTLTRNRCHDGGALPECMAAPKIAWKRPPARYVFSYRGKALNDHDLIQYLGFLAMGFPRMRFHDHRHIDAQRLRDLGVSDEAIGLSMGDTPEMADYYASVGGERRIAVASLRLADLSRRRRLSGASSPSGRTGA